MDKMLKFIVKAATKIISTNFFAKLLFGVDCSKSKFDYQIGFSTLLMKDALKKHIKVGNVVLDIGTGAFAIHSIWLRKNKKAEVIATEIDERYIQNAKKTAECNNAEIKIIKSDLFKNVREKFDWAIFNPPFRNNEDENGYKIVGRLLKEAPQKAKLMIVVNSYYVNRKKVEEIIKKNNYKIKDVVTKFMNPAKVYVVEK